MHADYVLRTALQNIYSSQQTWEAHIFYRWRNTGLEGLSDLLKVIFLEIGIAIGSV